MALTPDSSFEQVAEYIVKETKARGYRRDESVAALSTGIQESGLRPKAVSPNGLWRGIYQQDGGYPGRDDPNLNIAAFLDRLDVKRRSPGASPDPFKNIFWLQQRPSDPSADAAYDHGRKAYYDEIKQHIAVAERAYDRYSATPPPASPSTPVGYGMPNGTNSGGYGGSGAKFPDWVYALGNTFGLKPSTYPGHQESDRVEAGYARNPAHLNRGIDWAAPGAADEVDRMQRFADYLFSIRGELEQVIWWNPRTGRKVGVAGGSDVTNAPYYNYPGGYDDHRDHVHTRQSHPIPLPGNAILPPAPPAVPVALRPQFDEIEMFGRGSSKRSRQPINFFIHTEEGNGSAWSLAQYCQGQNNVSYHYTLRDRKVYDVVDTDLYSWSVLDANVFSINLCFAGARAADSRETWLKREGDIEVAAYLAVQDARKYGFSVEVLVPRWNLSGTEVYAGGPRAGISDHNYVTRELGIGDHHDVGPNFPWDRFAFYVNKYANPTATPGDDELSARAEQMIAELHAAFLTNQLTSFSPMRAPGQGTIGNLATVLRFMDSNIHVPLVIDLAKLGDPDTLDGLNQIIRTDLALYPDRAKDVTLANNILAEAKRHWAAAKPASVTVGQLNTAPASAAVPTPAVEAVTVSAPDLSYQLDSAQQEIVRLQQENAALRTKLDNRPITAVVPPPEPSSATNLTDLAEIPEYQDTTGDKIARAVDANMDYTDHVLGMDAAKRTALTRALTSIDPTKDGPQS